MSDKLFLGCAQWCAVLLLLSTAWLLVLWLLVLRSLAEILLWLAMAVS